MDVQYPTADITSDDKLWALLGYIFTPIIPIIVLLIEDKKNRPFLRYHSIQALAWGVIWVILSFLLVGLCLSPLYLVASIYFAIKAYGGEYLVIPLLTDFLKGQKWI